MVVKRYRPTAHPIIRNLKARLVLWTKPFRLPRFRLVHQLLGFFVLIVLIPLLILSYSVYGINQNAVKKQVRHFSEQTALAAYQQLELEMQWQKKELEQLARYLETRPTKQWSEPSNLSTLFNLYPDVRVVTIYDAKGQVQLRLSNPKHPLDTSEAQVLSNLSPIINDRASVNEFNFKLFTIKPKVGVYQYRLMGNYRLDNNIPSLQPVKIISVYRDFPDFNTLIEKSVADHKQSFILISPEGQVMASGGLNLQIGAISNELLTAFKRLPLGGTHHIAGAKEEDLDKDGEKEPSHHKVLMKLPSTSWGIILETPYALQKEYIRLAQTQTILLLMGCVLLIIILGLWYSRSIYRNFRQLIKGIQALAEGNYARQIRLITRAFTPFEIIYLTSEFNRMAQKIRQAWEDIQQLNLALADANTKLAKLDETKSNLIDTVSHELRTPLTSIKGYTARLIRSYDQIPKEEQIKNLKVVKQQADRLSRMVEDLLVIPELEQGGSFRVYLDSVDVKEQLRRCVQIIQDKADQTFDVTLPDEPVLIHADLDRMEQVILNLLDNAAKYAPTGSIVRVGLTQKTYGNKPYASLSFFNSSEAPIDDETAKSLFNKFTRLDERLTRTTRGTGLGLFITKSLIEAMGGEIVLSTANGFLIEVKMPLSQFGYTLNDGDETTPLLDVVTPN